MFEKGKKLVDEIWEYLIRKYNIAKAHLELLKDLGVTIVRNIKHNIKSSLAPAVVNEYGFLVYFENKPLLEGNGDDIKRFVDKIEDINKNSGSNASKKYLDELFDSKKLDDFINEQDFKFRK